MTMPVHSVLDCLHLYSSLKKKPQKMLLLTGLDPLKVRSRWYLSHFERPQTCFRSILWLWLLHFCNLQQKVVWNIDFHGFRGCSFGNMASLRWSFISRCVLKVDPPKFQIATIWKSNGVRVSNFQDFLVSVISTSIPNKKKNPWCRVYTPVWVGLEWPIHVLTTHKFLYLTSYMYVTHLYITHRHFFVYLYQLVQFVHWYLTRILMFYQSCEPHFTPMFA